MMGIVIGIAAGLWSTSGWSLSGKPVPVTGPIELHLPVEHDFSKPVFLTASPDQTNRLFVVEQDGRIFILTPGQRNPSLFLDIAEKLSTGGERGLLGLAFHPQYSKNGRFFVNYTRAQDGATVIAEYQVSSDPARADPQETIRLVIPQPYSNHNGGMIAFGPDAFLYIGTGDGGAGGDPENRAQDRKSLLGKFLRIDIDGPPPYRIPADNPFVGQPGQPEIFALGLRNPWRFSFDRATGDLWIADVGQNRWEEINYLPAGSPGGANFGWSVMEGSQRFGGAQQPTMILPVAEYGREFGCSVTGGYVYRGALPEWNGVYFYGDYCSGNVWGLTLSNGQWQSQVLFEADVRITSFGQDESGEVYLVNDAGNMYVLVKK